MILVEVDEGVAVDMAVAVVAAVGSIVDFQTVNKALLVRVLLRREILGEKGVAMADLVVLTVVVVAVISLMEKVVRVNALVGHLNAVVELGEGDYCLFNCPFNYRITLALYAFNMNISCVQK